MDSEFYIADPTNKEAQRLVEYVEVRPLPVSNFAWIHLGFVMVQIALLLLILAAGGTPYISGFFMIFSLLAAGVHLRPSLQRSGDIKKAKQCLQEGSIIAVPKGIKASFEKAAGVSEAQNSRPFWEANFFAVKDLLPLVPVLENRNVSDDRKEETRKIIDQKAVKAAAKFKEIEATANNARLFISDAEADSLLAMYRESDPPD